MYVCISPETEIGKAADELEPYAACGSWQDHIQNTRFKDNSSY